MKINNNKNFAGGYVEGDTFLHKSRPQGKIIASLFLLLGSGIGNGWSLLMVSVVSVLAVIVAKVPFRELLLIDRKSTRLNSSHKPISYAVFCLKKKKKEEKKWRTHNASARPTT